MRLACQGICRYDLKLCGVFPCCFEIQRILAAFIRQIAVYIFKIKIISRFYKILHTHAFFAKIIFRIEFIVTSPLTRQVRNQIRTSGRHTHAIIKMDIIVHTPVKNAGAICTSHTPAYIYNSCLYSFFADHISAFLIQISMFMPEFTVFTMRFAAFPNRSPIFLTGLHLPHSPLLP